MADDASIAKALEFLSQARDLGEAILHQMNTQEVIIYDPIPMAVMRIADKERGQLLIEASSKVMMGRFLRRWYSAMCEMPTSVHWTMDVDPADV